MSIGWQLAGPARRRVAPAVVVALAAALAVLAVITVLVVTDYRPPAPVVGVDAGASGGAARSVAPPSTVALTSGVLAGPVAGRAEAVSEHSVTLVGSHDHPAGVVVTNSGMATADVGGNVVVGSSEPDGSSASVSTGDATAVGNHSSTRVIP